MTVFDDRGPSAAESASPDPSLPRTLPTDTLPNIDIRETQHYRKRTELPRHGPFQLSKLLDPAREERVGDRVAIDLASLAALQRRELFNKAFDGHTAEYSYGVPFVEFVDEHEDRSSYPIYLLARQEVSRSGMATLTLLGQEDESFDRLDPYGRAFLTDLKKWTTAMGMESFGLKALPGGHLEGKELPFGFRLAAVVSELFDQPLVPVNPQTEDDPNISYWGVLEPTMYLGTDRLGRDLRLDPGSHTLSTKHRLDALETFLRTYIPKLAEAHELSSLPESICALVERNGFAAELALRSAGVAGRIEVREPTLEGPSTRDRKPDRTIYVHDDSTIEVRRPR